MNNLTNNMKHIIRSKADAQSYFDDLTIEIEK